MNSVDSILKLQNFFNTVDEQQSTSTSISVSLPNGATLATIRLVNGKIQQIRSANSFSHLTNLLRASYPDRCEELVAEAKRSFQEGVDFWEHLYESDLLDHAQITLLAQQYLINIAAEIATSGSVTPLVFRKMHLPRKTSSAFSFTTSELFATAMRTLTENLPDPLKTLYASLHTYAESGLLVNRSFTEDGELLPVSFFGLLDCSLKHLLTDSEEAHQLRLLNKKCDHLGYAILSQSEFVNIVFSTEHYLLFVKVRSRCDTAQVMNHFHKLCQPVSVS